MSQLRDEQPNEIRSWSWIIPADDHLNFLYSNENTLLEEQSEEPAEARAWSTYQSSNLENVLGEGPTQEQKVLLSTTLQDQKQQWKKDARGIEHIFAYIDRNRPPRQKKYRLTWRTFIGTMAGMEQIYARDDFLRYYEEFRPAFIFMDSVFRGIGQVMFCNNPLSGIIITIGLFIGNWELALYGLLGTCVSTLTAHIIGFNYDTIRAGFFQICTWIWLLGALKYRYFFVDGTILSPDLLKTVTNKPDLLNVSFPGYSVQDNFVGFFASVAQVYFISNPYTGAIILVGVSISSRILSFFALFGAVTAQLTAAYLLGLPSEAIHAGLWGFNSVLTCQALGGMFFLLYGYRIWIFTLFGSIMTVLAQAAVSSFLSAAGMPTLTFPFTVICWIFCLNAGSKNLIAVKLTAISIPEDHYHRFRLSQLVKTQFKFISHFTQFSSSYNEDITWAELAKLKEIFVPVLMCSYVYRDDINSMKTLMKQGVNIHSTDHNLRSPLHISASEGNIKITKWLVETLKINVNLVDKFGGTPFFDALWNGHFHLLPFLYSHGARLPAAKSRELAFYLNAFVYEGNLEAIKFFLSCGFNPNANDDDGRNSLHMAVITNQFDIVYYLVEESYVWLDMVDYFQQIAIDYALRLSDPTIANYLLYKRENNHMPSKILIDKFIPLQIVVENNQENKKDSKQQEEIEESLMCMDESLLPTLFCMIAVHEDIKVMINFLQEFPHLNALKFVDYDFRSAAHVAAAEGQLEIIRFLSQQCHPADFERVMRREDRWGVSPLDEAYRNGHIDICNFVNENIRTQINEMHRKIVEPTETESKNHFITCLLRKWKKVFRFCTLAASGAAEQINELFIRGYFLPTEIYADYHGRTPMHFAAANGHLNVIKVLIKYGYDGTTHMDRWGNYPVDEAQQKKFRRIVDELIQS